MTNNVKPLICDCIGDASALYKRLDLFVNRFVSNFGWTNVNRIFSGVHLQMVVLNTKRETDKEVFRNWAGNRDSN